MPTTKIEGRLPKDLFKDEKESSIEVTLSNKKIRQLILDYIRDLIEVVPKDSELQLGRRTILRDDTTSLLQSENIEATYKTTIM